MTLPPPRVVSCGCDPRPVVTIPQVIVTPASTIRLPGRIDPGMRGYYPLGEFAGRDLSGLGNDAIPSIETHPTEPGILCETAEVFAGDRYYDLPFDLDEIITVSAWVRPQQPKLETTLLSVGENLRFGLSWMLEPIIWVNQNAEDEDIVSADPLTAGKWVHLAFVRDDQEYRIFVNGRSVPIYHDGRTVQAAISPVDVPRGPATIGLYRGGSLWHGAIQDVVIRESAMTAREIAAERDSYCTPTMEVVA